MVNSEPPRQKSAVAGPIIMFVVALLAGVGIVGFVEPGFFLSDDKSDTSANDKADGKGEQSDTDAAPDNQDPTGPSTDSSDDSSGGATDSSDRETDTPSGPSPTAEPEAYLESFLQAVRDHDLAKIDKLSCGKFGPEDVDVSRLIDDESVSLTLDATTIRATDSTIDGHFTGVEEERGAIKGLVGGRDDDGTWCVDYFSWSW